MIRPIAQCISRLLTQLITRRDSPSVTDQEREKHLLTMQQSSFFRFILAVVVGMANPTHASCPRAGGEYVCPTGYTNM